MSSAFLALLARARLAAIGGLAILLALWAAPVAAIEPRTGDSITIPAGTTINDDLAVAGRSVIIGGRVSGDVYAGGNTITLLRSAQIDGDLFAAGETIIVDGTVGGSLRLAGNTLSVNGTIERGLLAGGNQVILNPNATVRGNWLSAGNAVHLLGAVGGGVTAGAGSVTIGGSVGRNVQVEVERELQIQPGARIGGNLTYVSPTEQVIPSSSVAGTVDRQIRPVQPRRQPIGQGVSGFVFSLVLLAGTLLVGLVLAWLAPNLYRSAQAIIERQALTTFGVGLAGLVLLPIVSFIVMVTILGLPLGILGVASWLIGSYLGWIVASAALAGVVLAALRRRGQPIAPAWLVLLGLIAVYIITRVPILGALFGLIVIALGLGSLILLLFQRRSTVQPPPALPASRLPI